MPQLVLLRHGQSTWNRQNLFTGWVDVRLSDQGEQEARNAGRLLAEEGLRPDMLHTSVLTRAIQTAQIALLECDRAWIPVRRFWRLNERHYGALQGLDKSETRKKYGDEQLQAWRRGYSTPPPPLEAGSEYDVRNDPRYAQVPPDDLPKGESLENVVGRMRPYVSDSLPRDLKSFDTVLVAAHGNSLRALIKDLEGIGDDEIAGLEIATGVPRVYELEEEMKVVSVRELGDPDAIAAAREAVANQAK